MQIQPIKTHKIQPNENLFEILDTYLPRLQEKSIVAIASKVVGICEGRVVKIDKTNQQQKEKLIKQEAEYYIEDKHLGFFMTINHGLLVANAGIDESNSNGYFSLWPKDPQKSANDIREYLTKKYSIKNIGVIITDSKLSPLRWGVTGYAIVHSGFQAIKNYVGTEDLFGRTLRVEQSNIADAIAASAVFSMGEGNEQQPIALLSDLQTISFQQRNPTKKELEAIKITIKDDLFGTMLNSVTWEKGKKKTS